MSITLYYQRFAEKASVGYHTNILPTKAAMSQIYSNVQNTIEKLLSLSYFQPTKILFDITLTLVCVGVLYILINILRLYLYIKDAKKEKLILEVIPPAFTEQNPFTTTQLFTSIHSLLKQPNKLLRFLDIPKSIALELVSTKETGIRYLLHVNEDDLQVIEKNLIAYLPGVKTKLVDDYIFDKKHANILEFKLSNDFVFPLKNLDNLKEYDPISYITGAMTKLSDNEVSSMQLVISPLSKAQTKSIQIIRHKFLNSKDLLSSIKDTSTHYLPVIKIIMQIILLPIGLLVFLLSEGREGPLLISGRKRTLPPTQYKDNLENQIRSKLDQKLYNVSLRLYTQTLSYKANNSVQKSFISALATFTNASFQSIGLIKSFNIPVLSKIKFFCYQNRLHGLNSRMVLSTTELSDIYHFPFERSTKTENISKLHYKELPAPISLKQERNLDIVFAKNLYGGVNTNIGLSEDERRRHVYILGATGTGKSTMLLSMIKQDIEHGKGLCVIDPHGDLIEQILSIIPADRVKDTIYFNPDDIGYPMGINLLELTPGLNQEEAIREKEFIAESIISVFHKIYTDKYSGPRMEYILRNTIHTAFLVPDATLFTIYKLLINTTFRKSVTKNLTDENLIDFWKYEFAKAGDYQKVKMISPITNKIGRFLFSSTAKRILEQPKSTINFDSIMNDGKVLLCNLAKGKVGEDNSSVFGVLLMAKIQLAALKRARMKPEQRKDFYLYVDEFQNFATPAFAQILSEARKYKLNAILAHQTTSQLEDSSLVKVTLANTGTVVCFRTANPEDERVILPQFQPYVEQGDIANLPSYHFYMKLGALNPEEPFSGVTLPININYSSNRVNDIVNSSRECYATKYSTTQSNTMDTNTLKTKPIIKI